MKKISDALEEGAKVVAQTQYTLIREHTRESPRPEGCVWAAVYYGLTGELPPKSGYDQLQEVIEKETGVYIGVEGPGSSLYHQAVIKNDSKGLSFRDLIKWFREWGY
ncbi:MAG TPA: hypothetical protein VGE45_01010 [Chloroflexia bacterium]|jgi:hypothetical protein